ncbi:MAG: hypothetical protein JSU92_02400 [Deltaproteobacteria bacterium]|nr:MAG: hypothetical protein JSU92_02400 [Deltaproteobacteria bacterium]
MVRRIMCFCLVSVIILLVSPHSLFSHDIDGIEHLFGATNINGAVGNGGLSVGFSSLGEITVLKWPSPSYYDQLHYKTSMAVNARELPHFGAADDMGSFAGIYYTGPSTGLKWFRDFPTTHIQAYFNEDSNILVTTSTDDELGLNVKSYDFVLPEKDLLVRYYEIQKLPGSEVTSASFVYYENMAPIKRKTAFAPTEDWIDDTLNDYAAIYDTRIGAVVHFLPGDESLGNLDQVLNGSEAGLSGRAEDFLDRVDTELGEGIYAVVGGYNPPLSYQVGSLPCSRGSWDHTPESAFEDVLDGDLSGSPAAGCQANSALQWSLSFDGSGYAEMTIFIAFSGHLNGEGGAKELLEEAKGTSVSDHMDTTESWWKDWLGKANLPNTPDNELIAFSKRTLISLKTGTDRGIGAIMASISVQPPYGEDWPRDGAFFNYALDIAGYPEMVAEHNLFYASVQRKEDGEDTLGSYPTPAGSFAMNYYADGVPGGPIDFEIDEVGLAVWTLWNHTKFLESEPEQKAYLKSIYPSIRLGAEALMRCRDEVTGLQCLANEDDNPAFTQSLHGAVTVHLGLRSAIEAGEAYQEAEEILNQWRDRLSELEGATLENYYSEEAGNFGVGGGSGSWLIWPVKLLPFDDSRMLSQADYASAGMWPHLNKETNGVVYQGKTTLALARIWKDDSEKLNTVKDALDILAKEVPTKGARHMGEVSVIREYDGSLLSEFSNRVAVPHIWEASLVYLSLMAVYNPEDFDRVEERTVTISWEDNGEDGCGCTSIPENGKVRAAGEFFIILWFLLLTGSYIFIYFREWQGIERSSKE